MDGRSHPITSLRICALLLLASAALLVWPDQAVANCHIATFEENEVAVDEAGGHAEIFLELDGTGPNTCSGTIRWKTENGTAVAPGDYTASQGELKWSPGSDRRKSIRVPIVDDSVGEPTETFRVTLTAGPGDIRPEDAASEEGGPTAIARIRDDDGGPSPGASPTATTTAQTEPTVTATPTPTNTAGTVQAAPAAADRSSSGAVIGILAALIVLAGAGAWWMMRKRAG